MFNKQNGIAYDYYKCIDGVWKHYDNVDSTAFGKVKDERDGQTYRTIKIGEQTWLAENLNYEMDEGSYCYRDSSKYCNIYGHLYSQEAALTACPVGWHLPSNYEWEDLPDSTKSILDLRDFSWDGSNKYGSRRCRQAMELNFLNTVLLENMQDGGLRQIILRRTAIFLA